MFLGVYEVVRKAIKEAPEITPEEAEILGL